MSNNINNHSVILDRDKCVGCTNCIKRCPTQAIRVRDGKAKILPNMCIDCGECIRICTQRAKKAQYDKLETLDEFKWKIALPAPALYAQFNNLSDVDYVLTGLLRCGFDDVFEVSRAAELVSSYTRDMLLDKNVKKPLISSACPAVVRLINARFPYLTDNIQALQPPVEVAASMARKDALAAHPELASEDIGVFFISPCPAKVSYVRNPIGVEKSQVDRVLSISEVYFKLISEMKKIDKPLQLSHSGVIGISWAGTGGEAAALLNEKYLAADGIENVINVLNEIENESMSQLEFIELNACSGGCVGGALNVVNPYIAKARLQRLRKYLPFSQNRPDPKSHPEDFAWTVPLEHTPVLKLSDDIQEAMRMMSRIEELTKSFPGTDCGSCGAPSCKAMAEDVVLGKASENDCIYKIREKFEQMNTTRDKDEL
ncbi:MAG: [Fe-Fe] hydrogenase large subunit C-terminal domain-containing protein [Eubacteriales bacterium]